MAKSTKTVPQAYPRIDDDSRKDYGCLDDSTLVAHPGKLPVEKLKGLIREAISNANSKSSREILSIPPDATEEVVAEICKREGRKLFEYFRKSCFDPPLFTDKLYRRDYMDVGIEQAREYVRWKHQENDRLRKQMLISNGAWRLLKQMSCADRQYLIYEMMAESIPAKSFFSPKEIPKSLLESFGNCCYEFGLVDESGRFSDPQRLIQFFCAKSDFVGWGDEYEHFTYS